MPQMTPESMGWEEILKEGTASSTMESSFLYTQEATESFWSVCLRAKL